MKKYIILTLLISLSYICYSQGITFNRLEKPYSGSLMITSILKDKNHFYCSVLQIDTPNNQYQQYGILKLDSSFNYVDSSLINTAKVVILEYGKGFDMSKNDSTYIIAGTVRDSLQNSKYNGYLVRFDKNLDTLWTRQISHPDTAYADTCLTPWVVLTDVKVTPEGNYLIAGNYNHHCQGERDRSFIIKMDPLGGIFWYKFYDPNVVIYPIQNIEIDLADSGYYFISWNNSFWKLFKSDQEGSILWSVDYTSEPCYNVNAIRIFNNNIYVASRYVNPPTLPGTRAKLTVSSINSQTHTLNWNKNFPFNSVYSIFLRGETISIQPTPGGNIAIGMPGLRPAGNDQFLSGNRGFLLLLSPNGDSLWSRYYTNYSDDPNTDVLLHDMVVCDDGGFLFGGTFFNPQYDPIFFKAWLVKTDSNGIAPMSFTVSVEEETLIVKRNPPVLYPVPANDQLNIRLFQEELQGSLLIEIFSLSGQCVKQQQCSPNETEYRINIQDLPSGTWLIRITSGGETLYTERFVKK